VEPSPAQRRQRPYEPFSIDADDNPMTSPRRRWFTFTLRTLLIGLTLVSLFLGWIIPEIQSQIEAGRRALLQNRLIDHTGAMTEEQYQALVKSMHVPEMLDREAD
jgi:hypothetical protein